jgi:hypothetical protein
VLSECPDNVEDGLEFTASLAIVQLDDSWRILRGL